MQWPLLLQWKKLYNHLSQAAFEIKQKLSRVFSDLKKLYIVLRVSASVAEMVNHKLSLNF